MKFAFFIGCNIPARVQQYESAARAVLAKLGVDLVDIRDFNCCGYPLQNADYESSLVFSARNLSLAEKEGLNILALCKCCFGTLKKAQHALNQSAERRQAVAQILKKEGLAYQGDSEISHFLTILHKQIGVKKIKEAIAHPYKGLKIATHYGCHALRPSEITRFDDPVAPVVFDDLVKATGAGSVEWPLKLDCCGAPLTGINDTLSTDLTARKVADGKNAGADYFCVACPWCQLQFDGIQKRMAQQGGSNSLLPSLIYPQLLGLAMGIDRETLGLDLNEIGLGDIEGYLSQE